MEAFSTSSLRHLTPDFGVLPSGSGLLAFRPISDATQSLEFTLLSRSVAFISTQLSVVRRLLAIVCDLVPLIGDALSFIGDPFAPRELRLTPREGLRALSQPGIVPVALALSVGTVVRDHASI